MSIIMGDDRGGRILDIQGRDFFEPCRSSIRSRVRNIRMNMNI